MISFIYTEIFFLKRNNFTGIGEHLLNYSRSPPVVKEGDALEYMQLNRVNFDQKYYLKGMILVYKNDTR